MPSKPEISAASSEQRHAIDHRGGPLLLVGPAGSGRTETIARRLARLAQGGVPPERTLVLTRSRAAAERIRHRVQSLLSGPFEELWIEPYPALAERLLRENAVEAGLDPFFATVGVADRLAMLLDRLSDLPLRRHEIRGNPAGLLARLLERIDTLKAEAVTPGGLRTWAAGREREAAGEAAREASRRELEFAELYARHDRILTEAGSLDTGDLVLELSRMLRDRADVRERLGARFPEAMADEYEDAGAAHRGLLEEIAPHGRLLVACDDAQAIRRFRGARVGAARLFRELHPGCEEIALEDDLRGGGRIAHAAAAVAGREPAAEAASDDGVVTFWRSRNRAAQAQAAAREIEHLLATEDVSPEQICVIVGQTRREGGLVAAALEERNVPFRLAGGAALFQRPEVRDAIAWLRVLADPNDAPAAVRAVTRPPVELRSVDLARCTLIARRRKLDMISAFEAALESPQLPPEARDRIQAFLRLYRAAASALEEMRADAFVRRLIERIGLRRQQLFAASPETAYRLVTLSRLAELATAWTRREPRASTRDFVRHLTAVAEAGELGDDPLAAPPPAGVLLAEPEQVKGLEFDHVYVLDLDHDAAAEDTARDGWIPDDLLAEPAAGPSEDQASHGARLTYVAVTRAGRSLVLGWPEETPRGPARPSPLYEAARAALDGEEEVHDEELFGPAEGLHATYRMVQHEVLESSWRAGAALGEMRLDTAEDVDRAVAGYLELVKLAALIQRPGSEPAIEAIEALNQLLAQAATPGQRAILDASVLDEYVIGEEREQQRRRELIASRGEPSLEAFIPTRGDGLALSASDLDLYRICPLKYKFARVFAIPEEPTINQRFGILIHQVLERFHAGELKDADPSREGEEQQLRRGLDRLLWLFEAGWRRAGFGASDDELQYRDRAVAALARYWERHLRSDSMPIWLERAFAFEIGPHQLRGRIDRVDRLPGGGYELIDYKTGEPKTASELVRDLQLALYRIGARESWQVDAEAGSYWYVLEDEKVPVPSAPDDRERVERTVIDVAEGIQAQDFEPRPSYEICSWCDYRLICPASEA
jgi:DNA helicase II / ATP-dependent DNA helicase PcrA